MRVLTLRVASEAIVTYHRRRRKGAKKQTERIQRSENKVADGDSHPLFLGGRGVVEFCIVPSFVYLSG
jgi:hypothetical protein